MWEGVEHRTELQHIDPHCYGHNSVSFPFSWAAQPGACGPILLGAGFLYRILSPTHLISKLTDFLSSPWLYNNLTSTLLPASVTISHSFNPSTVNWYSRSTVNWYSSNGCTCYLHRCISDFDSPAGSEVNIQQNAPYQRCYSSAKTAWVFYNPRMRLQQRHYWLIRFVLVSLRFVNGISTIVGYLMPNPFLYIWTANSV